VEEIVVEMKNNGGMDISSLSFLWGLMPRYRQQESEARASILSQILEPAAADRLGRIRMVKESRATDVENRLIMLARSGQLQQKVTEDQLKQMLGSLTEHERETKGGLDNMKVVRRGGWDDDDLDDLLEGT
jgi:programmed cell death protein 5